MLSHFHTIPQCNGQTDRQTDRFAISILHVSVCVEFYLYPTVGTVLIHSVKPELTE